MKASKINVNGLEAKTKVQTTAKYIQFDMWDRTGTKRYNAKNRRMLNGPVNAKMFTEVLNKAATTLQHYDFALPSKHILIM